MKRRIIAVISDTHAGHKLGLANPKTELEEIENGEVKKYHPTLSETQKFMYETYQWGVSETIKLAGKDEIVLIHNGDPTHGKASFLELMTSKLSDQLLMAQANVEEWLQYPNIHTVRFAAGTGLHELGEASAQVLISNALRGKHSKLDIGVVYHGLLDIDGFTIDYAHHGPNVGIRKWLEGNELRYYLRSIMIGEVLEGRTPPHLVLRGHYHVYRKEYLEMTANGKTYESWAVILPGFTFKDDYTRRATRSEFKQNLGMMAFEVIDGHLYKSHRFTRTIDIRTKEIV